MTEEDVRQVTESAKDILRTRGDVFSEHILAYISKLEEEKAEEYVKKEVCVKICPTWKARGEKCDLFPKCHYVSSKIKFYRLGLAEGKPKWHDLRKDPNDLPKEGIEVLVLYSNTYDDNGLVLDKYALRYELAQYINDEEDLTEWYWVDARTDDMVHEVIAWCEHPKFEE